MAISVKIYAAEVQKKMDEAFHKELEDIGLKIETEAKKNAPVVTGRLRNSIDSFVEGKTVSIGSDVEYAKFVEFGTVHQRPQLFLTRAFLENLDAIKAILSRKIE